MHYISTIIVKINSIILIESHYSNMIFNLKLYKFSVILVIIGDKNVVDDYFKFWNLNFIKHRWKYI